MSIAMDFPSDVRCLFRLTGYTQEPDPLSFEDGNDVKDMTDYPSRAEVIRSWGMSVEEYDDCN